jgi:hypothetical protein
LGFSVLLNTNAQNCLGKQLLFNGFTQWAWAPSLPKDGYALEHRVDELNPRSKASPGKPADFTSTGVILWRLSTTGEDDLWCFVFEHPYTYCLVLDSDPEGTKPYRVCEQYADIVNLVNRAEALKDTLLRSGWKDIDVE